MSPDKTNLSEDKRSLPQGKMNLFQALLYKGSVQRVCPFGRLRIRVGFVEASLTYSQTGSQIGGRVKMVGQDPCLVSLDGYGRDKLNILAHEAGHASALSHNYLYDPNINHWLMRFGVEPYWSNDSNAAKRFMRDEADYIKANSSYYVPAQ